MRPDVQIGKQSKWLIFFYLVLLKYRTPQRNVLNFHLLIERQSVLSRNSPTPPNMHCHVLAYTISHLHHKISHQNLTHKEEENYFWCGTTLCHLAYLLIALYGYAVPGPAYTTMLRLYYITKFRLYIQVQPASYSAT